MLIVPDQISNRIFLKVALFQLNDVTLMISVYAKRNMKRNEMVGWFSLGLNSSGPEEAQHFNDMRDAANINGQVGKCDLIARWHVLVVRDLKYLWTFFIHESQLFTGSFTNYVIDFLGDSKFIDNLNSTNWVFDQKTPKT